MKEKKKQKTDGDTSTEAADILNHTVHFRVTSDKYEELERRAKAAGLNLSDYLRASSLGASGYRRGQGHELLGQAISELRRVGNNVNQIARHLNKGGAVDKGEIAEVMKVLLHTLEQMRKVSLK
jgi:hypothetical protein